VKESFDSSQAGTFRTESVAVKHEEIRISEARMLLSVEAMDLAPWIVYPRFWR